MKSNRTYAPREVAIFASKANIDAHITTSFISAVSAIEQLQQ